MTKIAVCSDIHLEFGPIELINTEGADVLVLSGDIMVAADIDRLDANLMPSSKRARYAQFLETCSRNFPAVVYVMGNHEHYHGDYADTANVLRKFCADYANIHFLDNESVTIGEHLFVGGTLWTDMNNEDPLTLHSIQGMMNDFIVVKNSRNPVSYRAPSMNPDNPDGWEMHTRPATFKPMDALAEHRAMLQYLKIVLENSPGQSVVVCGHHAPSKHSTHPRYKDAVVMNGAYSSDLSEFILDHPEIKLWTHGHTHEPFDYCIGTTRIVCNPRGYIDYEDRADDFELKYVEI
jgi:Icc-related predicted phosphoesterase